MSAYLKADENLDRGAFAAAIAMDGDTIAIAGPGEDRGANPGETAVDSGAVYVFATDCSLVPGGAKVPGC